MRRKKPGRRRQDLLVKRKINEKISKKLVGLFLIVVLALVGLSLRITYINARDGEQYKRQVLSQTQQQYDSRVIPFKRGDILDRNGTILATSEKVYNLILDCKVVNTVVKVKGVETQRYLEPTVEALVELFGLDEAEIRSKLTDSETKDSHYQILKKQMSITDKKKLEAYLDVSSDENRDLTAQEKTKRQRVKGIWFEENYQRVYPMNSLACDLIGFTYGDNTADWGIEGYYSSVLNGVNGRQFGYFNSDADVEQTIIDPVDGKNVTSTIDANIQQMIRNALENYQERMSDGPNGSRGAKNVGIMVMNPNNGEILGMDSLDWYDLNNPRDLTPFYTQAEIEAMDEQKQLNALFEIWRNYCISDAYEPGSTFKPMTVAAGLESGAITEEDIYYCKGAKNVAGHAIRCAVYPNAHETQTLGETLKHSCNVAMMDIGEQIGAENFLRYEQMFNFGQYTGIDLPGESAGMLHSLEKLGVTELATSSFGQGFTCTMVQEIAAFSSVINGGTYYKPHVVSTITDSSGAVVKNIDPVTVRQVISREVSDEVREYLGTVMESDGTGSHANVSGYSMGGKTGTAQKIPRGNGKYLVSFIGFAPLDNPQVVVYVVVDEPNVENQASSIYAQEIYKEIMTELMPYMNIFPTDPSKVEKADTSSEGNAERGISDENIPNPPSDDSEKNTDAVEGKNNDLLSNGISNSDASITNQ